MAMVAVVGQWNTETFDWNSKQDDAMEAKLFLKDPSIDAPPPLSGMSAQRVGGRGENGFDKLTSNIGKRRFSCGGLLYRRGYEQCILLRKGRVLSPIFVCDIAAGDRYFAGRSEGGDYFQEL